MDKETRLITHDGLTTRDLVDAGSRVAGALGRKLEDAQRRIKELEEAITDALSLSEDVARDILEAVLAKP